MKRAIVLSGGGSKGAYQIGVWKALRQLKIDYSIVTGTSVGALNGALMVQGSFHKGLALWRRLSFNLIFDKKEVDFTSAKNLNDVYKVYAKNMIAGGINPIELEKNLKNVIKEKKVRNSKIDYGIVTVKVPKLEAKCLSKNQIPEGKLTDYIMASATCFPAFQLKKIGNDKFIDGGFYDNMPINLAIKLGATEIIAVDLEAIGRKQEPKKDVEITYISPNNDLGSFLVFDSNIAQANIKYGYNDTLKAFGHLEGQSFTFKKGQLKSNYQKYNERFRKIAKIIYELHDDKLIDKIIMNNDIKLIATGKEISVQRIFNKQMEYLGKILELDASDIYTTRRFNNMLLKKLNSIQTLDLKMIEKKIKNNQVKDLLHTKLIVKYIYEKLNNEPLNKKNIRYLMTIAKIFPKDFIGALYLSSIEYSWF